MMPLLLSLKPRFAELVFIGEKTVELRRRVASTMTGREVFIYVSSPVRMIRGGFRIAEVWSSDPETVWGEVASRAGVDKAEYDARGLESDSTNARSAVAVFGGQPRFGSRLVEYGC